MEKKELLEIKEKIELDKVELQSDPCRYAYKRTGERCLYDCCCDCSPVKDKCHPYKVIEY